MIVFVSGYVSEAALRSAVRGAVVRALVVGTGGHALWQGVTDHAGGFGFELQVDDYPDAHVLTIEVDILGECVGRKKVAWKDVVAAGAHVDFVVEADRPPRASDPAPFPFPIGFPATIPPPVDRPPQVPAHPMMALPFLLQHSYPRDPEEEDSAAETVFSEVSRPASDPP